MLKLMSLKMNIKYDEDEETPNNYALCNDGQPGRASTLKCNRSFYKYICRNCNGMKYINTHLFHIFIEELE